MGLGKTLQTIAYVERFKHKIIVIVPANLLLNWKREIHKFTTSDCAIINSQSTRTKKHAINYDNENLRYLLISYGYLKHFINKTKQGKSKRYVYLPTDNLIKVKKMGFNNVVLDESQYIMNYGSLRTKMVRQISKFLGGFSLLLSGTPIKSRPIEFFTQLNLVCPNKFNNWRNYAQTFCSSGTNSMGYEEYKGANNLDLLHDLVKPIYYRRLKHEVLHELPSKIRQMNIYDLESEDYNEYQKMMNTIANATQNLKVLEAINKMRLMLSEFITDKTISCVDSILDVTDEKVVIGSCFRKPMNKFLEKYGSIATAYHGGMSLKQKDDSFQNFNRDPNIRILIGTIQALSVGLNGQVISRVVVNDLPWTPADCMQFEDRAYRDGQTKHVHIYYHGFANTYQETMFDMIDNKAKLSETILDGKVSTQGHVLDMIINEAKLKSA